MRDDGYEIDVEVARRACDLRRRFALKNDRIHLQAIEKMVGEKFPGSSAQLLEPALFGLFKDTLRQGQQISWDAALLHAEENDASSPFACEGCGVFQGGSRVRREIR